MMMRADEGYTPNEKCSLEEMVACALADDTDACLAACTGNEEEEPQGNGLATVSGKAAASQEVPYDAVNVKVGTVTLKAGEYDTKVSSVEISRDGLSTFAAGKLTVALRNASIETDPVAISTSTNKAKVKFSPALELKAGQSMTFDVIADMSTQTATNNNDSHNFKVTDVIVSNGTSTGCPVKLGSIKTTNAVSKTFNVAVEQGDTPLKAGETEKKLIVVKVDFNNADGTLNRIVLGDATAAEDLDTLFSDLKAYVNDKEVGTVSISDEKIIISDLNISKEKYETAEVEVRGDIISSKNTTTVTFKVTNVEASEAAYGFGMKSATAMPVTAGATTVNGYDVVFKKAALENKTVIPGTNNVLVFDSTIKSASDVVIKGLTVTPTTTLAATDLKDDSVRLLVNGEEVTYSNADALTATPVTTNVTIEEGKEARIQILLNTTDTAAGKDIKYNVAITDIRSVEKSSTNFAAALSAVNGDKVEFKAAGVTVAAATESAPATRSLFANEEQEMGRFSIKADGEKVTVKGFTLELDSNITDPSVYVDSNISLVDVATDDVITATFADLSAGKIVVSNMNYSIEKDKTANIKVMIDMPSIDTADFGKYMKLSVAANTIKASANGKNITTNAATPLSTENYTLRITAPKITLSKASDNMFKVTITNMDNNDDGVEFNDLSYRVRTTAANTDFKGKVCIVEDVNTITCGAIANNFGTVLTYTRLGSPAVAAVPAVATAVASPVVADIATYYESDGLTTGTPGQYVDANGATYTLTTDTAIDTSKTYYTLVEGSNAVAADPTARNNYTLSKNGEKVLYILVDGESIEPDVLKADVTSLSYDKDNAVYTDTLTAEKYSVSKMLNE